MKPRSIRDMIRAKETIERGEVKPASVWELKPNGKGAFTRQNLGHGAIKDGISRPSETPSVCRRQSGGE
jgi:hypothetical protein